MFILNWSVLAVIRLRKWRLYINQKVSGLNLNVEAVLGKILVHPCVREGVCVCVWIWAKKHLGLERACMNETCTTGRF